MDYSIDAKTAATPGANHRSTTRMRLHPAPTTPACPWEGSPLSTSRHPGHCRGPLLIELSHLAHARRFGNESGTRFLAFATHVENLDANLLG